MDSLKLQRTVEDKAVADRINKAVAERLNHMAAERNRRDAAVQKIMEDLLRDGTEAQRIVASDYFEANRLLKLSWQGGAGSSSQQGGTGSSSQQGSTGSSSKK